MIGIGKKQWVDILIRADLHQLAKIFGSRNTDKAANKVASSPALTPGNKPTPAPQNLL